MSKSIRVSGKTVNDAIMNAAIELSTTSDGIDYKVIEHESKGFLGLGAKDAVIEAWIREEEPEKEQEKEREKEPEKEPEDTSVKAPAPADDAAASVSGKGSAAASADEKTSSEKSGDKAFTKSGSRKGSSKGKKAAGDQDSEDQAGEKAGASSEDVTYGSDEEEYEGRRRHGRRDDIKVLDDPSEAIERAETFLKDVFASMDMEVEITSNYDGECLGISMEGDEMGLLIGKRGQTLDSLQYLTSLVVNKGKPYYVRVKLDTENYRERRKATLENLAKNIAVKVKKTRQTVYLEPMNPYERRIIHSALQDDPFVTTHSEGEEPDRKVVVTLKKDADLDALERKYGERRGRYGRGGRGGYGHGRGGRGGYGRGNRYSREDREEREDSTYAEQPDEAPVREAEAPVQEAPQSEE